MTARRTPVGAVLLIGGAVVAGVSVFSTWAEVGPVQIGHVDVIYRRYRGWDLPEGVLVWTLAVVAVLAGAAHVTAVSSRSRSRWAVVASACGIVAVVTGAWVEVTLERRIIENVAIEFVGGNARAALGIVGSVDDRSGYLPAPAGGVLMLLGSFVEWKNLRRRTGAPND